ncbi:MAG: ABC transporter permease, partial [Paenibacillus macerans]|nr:ABC transporter permease [Paenibacillus macerans]
MTNEHLAGLAELVDEGIQLDRKIKEDEKRLDAIKAELQAVAVEVMDNKNLKWLQIFGNDGHFNVAQKEKFEIDDYTTLIEVMGEKAKSKIVREEKIKYTTETRFKAKLIALFKDDFSTDGQTLDDVLAGLGLDATTIKSMKKKLKGDYIKDKRVLESVGVTGECEEELDAIRQIKNTELIERFFSDLNPIPFPF